MVELPISNSIKEYYKQYGFTFTDSERATIFWNSSLPLSEKLIALREIFDTTTDTVLKEQIQRRLDIEVETERAFMSRDSDYIHTVILDDSRDADGVFASIDAAVAYGKENCEETFKISKAILEDKINPNEAENILLGGDAVMKKDGTLIYCNCYNSKEVEVVLINSIEPSGFEEAYVSVQNPFEYGDIVRIEGDADSRPAIVVTSQKHWKEIKERQKQSKFPKNYYSNTLTVEYLYSDGEFSHEHPDIFSLEKLEYWDNEKEWKLLQAISNLMKGDGWIEEVFDKYSVNKCTKR